jgi:hypothetical protein
MPPALAVIATGVEVVTALVGIAKVALVAPSPSPCPSPSREDDKDLVRDDPKQLAPETAGSNRTFDLVSDREVCESKPNFLEASVYSRFDIARAFGESPTLQKFFPCARQAGERGSELAPRPTERHRVLGQWGRESTYPRFFGRISYFDNGLGHTFKCATSVLTPTDSPSLASVLQRQPDRRARHHGAHEQKQNLE